MNEDNAPLHEKPGFITRLTHLREQIGHYLLLPDLAGKTGKELRAQVQNDGLATPGYMLMCGLSAGISTLGLLQGSTAVVIGAMLVSPLMSPIVALGFGFSSIDGKRIKDAARVVMIGAAIGILTALLLTWLSPIRNATPEIIARTEPSLLDLLIALLSGTAGGYAVVKQLGATAIGVAIATALMPPLATIGYGIGVWRLDFAAGALLLFLTNLAAIAFAIAVVARLSGAARPLSHVEKNPYFLIAGCAAFLSLATPLGLTLLRLSNEAGLRSTSQDVLMNELKVSKRNITQLDVSWSLRGDPKIDAVVIAPNFRNDAQNTVLEILTQRIGETPELNLQQIIAADIESQTRAIVDAAMARTSAGINGDVPPYSDIRAAMSIPVQSMWVDRSERIVNIVPIEAEGWTLKDYFDAEKISENNAGGWKVHVIPPPRKEMAVLLQDISIESDGKIEQPSPDDDISITDNAEVSGSDGNQGNSDNIQNPINTDAIHSALAIWAMQRWGLRDVVIEKVTTQDEDKDISESEKPLEKLESDDRGQILQSNRQKIIAEIEAAGIAISYKDAGIIDDDIISITTYGRTPSQRDIIPQ